MNDTMARSPKDHPRARLNNDAQGIRHEKNQRKHYCNFKRLLAVLLVLAVTCGMLPTTARAEGEMPDARTTSGTALSAQLQTDYNFYYIDIPSSETAIRLKYNADTLSNEATGLSFEPDSDCYAVITRTSILSDEMLADYANDGLDFNAILNKTTGTYQYSFIRSSSDAVIILCWAKPEEKAGLAEISAADASLYTPHPLNAEKYWMVLDKGKTSGSFSFRIDENTDSVYYSDSTYTAKGNVPSLSDGRYTVPFESSGFTNAGNGEISETRYIALATETGSVTGFCITAYRRTGAVDEPDSVVDYLCIGSQYTNGGNTVTGTYGLYPENTLRGRGFWYSPTSAGNFGGYITYYYDQAITNDAKNPYGIDFVVYGNSNGSEQFSEPGNVLVSADGKTWYTLAGSEHYEDTTIWDYSVTYKKDADTGYTRVGDELYEYYKYPAAENYPLYSWQTGNDESTAVCGVYLPGNGGNAAFPAWGYADVKVNCFGNWGTGSAGTVTGIARDPYWKQPSYLTNSTARPAETDKDQVNEYGGDGFDLAWAVSADGMPVTLDSIHYIKVQTASNVIAGATGEKSTEVNAVARAEAGDKDVGVTTAPTAIAVDNNKLDLSDGQYVYNATVSGVFDVVVTAGSGDNVYINNKRASDVSFRDIPDHGIIRVIVQNGEKEPLIYYLKVVDDGQSTDNQVTAITFDADGGKIGDYSSVTRYYDVNSSAVFPTPVREGYAFLGWYYGQKPYSTINTDMPSALTLTAKWKNNDSGGSPTKTISVKFRLIGATLSADHIDLSNGDYKGSKYVTWIKTTSCSMKETDTVYDLFTKALTDAGLQSVGADTDYVKTIYAPSALGGYSLSEFTNGRYSGWMYTVNGSHPAYGLKDCTLKDGDTVVWHYVNDYRYEVEDWNKIGGGGWASKATDDTYYNKWMEAADENPPSAGGSSSGDAASGSNALTPKAAAVKGIAKIKISTGQAAKVIASAKENNNAAIFITPEITGGANEVTIELPTTMLASMAANTNADLQVQVPMGMVTIPHNALSAIASAATGDDIVITVTRKSASDVTDKSIDTAGAVIVEVTVASNGKAITDFGGARLVISIPVDDTYTEGQSCRVIIISADGGKKIVYGKCIKADGKLMVQVTVTHLSTFIVSGKTPMPFTDVSGHWALEAITCAWDNDLTNGVGGRLFDPEGTLNRAAFVTMLYRLEGSPAVAGAGSFSDVSAGQWYTNAVIWAAENKIANGMGGGTFAPFTEITREQMAVMLMHYADYKKYDVSKANDLTGYADAGSISAWALGALKWANAEGLIKGRSLTAIAPDGGATRAEAATILMRFAESHK